MMEEDIVMRAAMPLKIKSAATICLLNALSTHFIFLRHVEEDNHVSPQNLDFFKYIELPLYAG